VSVVLPASGCDMIAKVLRLFISFSYFIIIFRSRLQLAIIWSKVFWDAKVRCPIHCINDGIYLSIPFKSDQENLYHSNRPNQEQLYPHTDRSDCRSIFFSTVAIHLELKKIYRHKMKRA
jgi:hypothetical protein